MSKNALIEKAKARLAELKQKQSRGGDRPFRYGKFKYGKNILRVYKREEDEGFDLNLQFHRDVGIDQVKVLCPKSLDPDAACPMCEEADRLMTECRKYKRDDPRNKKLWKERGELISRNRFFIQGNILTVDGPITSGDEKDGGGKPADKPELFEVGGTIIKPLLAFYVDDEQEVNGPWWEEGNRYDFVIEKEKTGEAPEDVEYSVKATKKYVSVDTSEIESSKLLDMSEHQGKPQLKTYAEIEALYKGEEYDPESDPERKKDAKAGGKPASKPATKPGKPASKKPEPEDDEPEAEEDEAAEPTEEETETVVSAKDCEKGAKYTNGEDDEALTYLGAAKGGGRVFQKADGKKIKLDDDATLAPYMEPAEEEPEAEEDEPAEEDDVGDGGESDEPAEAEEEEQEEPEEKPAPKKPAASSAKPAAKKPVCFGEAGDYDPKDEQCKKCPFQAECVKEQKRRAAAADESEPEESDEPADEVEDEPEEKPAPKKTGKPATKKPEPEEDEAVEETDDKAEDVEAKMRAALGKKPGAGKPATKPGKK